jgi:hypothetical protein
MISRHERKELVLLSHQYIMAKDVHHVHRCTVDVRHTYEVNHGLLRQILIMLKCGHLALL